MIIFYPSGGKGILRGANKNWNFSCPKYGEQFHLKVLRSHGCFKKPIENPEHNVSRSDRIFSEQVCYHFFQVRW